MANRRDMRGAGMMPCQFSPTVRDVLLKNNLDVQLYRDMNTGKYYIDAQGRGRTDFRHVVREITPQQADLMSRYGYNSTDRKVYNEVKKLLPEATLPAILEQARNARNNPLHWSPVNMYSPAVNHHRDGLATPTKPRYGLFGYRRFSGPGDETIPGFMPHYSVRDGRVLPTTGVFARRPVQAAAAAAPAVIDAEVRLQKPVEALREKGKGLAYSKEITSPVYFTKEKFLEVMHSHGIDIDEKEKMLVIRSSEARRDVAYPLTDEQLKKLLNNSILPEEGGVSLEDRLKLINDSNGYKRDFRSPITKEMLESKELVNVRLTDTARDEIEKDFLEYERQEAYLKAREDAQQKAQEKYLAEEGRIRRDPNAISGREIGMLLGGAWYNQTAHGREAVVTEIRVDAPTATKEQEKEASKKVVEHLEKTIGEYEQRIATLQREDREIERKMKDSPADREALQARRNEIRAEVRGIRHDLDYDREWLKRQKDIGSHPAVNYTMKAVINGEQFVTNISKKDYEEFLRVDDEHRLKMFDELCDKVKIGKSTPDEGRPYDIVTLADGRMMTREELKVEQALDRTAYGEDLRQAMPEKGFFREGRNGREVSVSDITVQPTQEGKFKMTAVVNGTAVSHEISQKQYDKFLAVDDYQRMRMVSKVFDEFDIKTRGSDRLALDDVYIGTAPEAQRQPQYEPSLFLSHTERQVKASELSQMNFDMAEQSRSQEQQQQQAAHQGRGMG